MRAAAMTVVIAPDSFKSSAPAAAVAAALAQGWVSVRPDTEIRMVPLADGGEGTLDAWAGGGAWHTHRLAVDGPDGRRVEARWLLEPGGEALIELAESSGITLMEHLAPLDAHTRGLGQVMAAALDAGARALIVAVGGSASTDGGAGVLAALGARLLDVHGHDVAPGGRGLATLDRIDASGLRPLPSGGVTVLTDVTNPLLGPEGAAAVYGPQKGASPQDVAFLDDALARFARVLRRDLAPAADATMPGAGAAGGTAYGLAAWGARLAPGAAAVADAAGLDRALTDADLVITGEGRFDGQSSRGKVVAEVASRARRVGVPCALVAGAIAAPTGGFTEAVALAGLAGSPDRSMADPLVYLREAGAALARSVTR